MGGDEFLVIYPNCNQEQAKEYIDSVKQVAKTIKIFNNPLSFAVGYNTIDSFTKNMKFNIDLADKEMYINKSEMKSKMKKIGALHE